MIVLKGDKKKIEMTKEESKEKPKKTIPPIDANAKATKELALAIKDLAKSKQNINLSQEPNTEIMEALIKLNETQQTLIEKLNFDQEARVKNWEFSVTRDRRGAIEKISAIGE